MTNLSQIQHDNFFEVFFVIKDERNSLPYSNDDFGMDVANPLDATKFSNQEDAENWIREFNHGEIPRGLAVEGFVVNQVRKTIF